MSTKSPKLIDKLTQLDGVGPALAKTLISKGVTKVADLKKPEYAAMISEETKYALKYKIEKRNTWDFIHSAIGNLPKYIIPVGSYRRKVPIIKDIDLLTTRPLSEVVVDLKNLFLERTIPFEIIGEYSSGDKKKSMIVLFAGKYLRLDLFKTTEEELPSALLHWTGSKNFNIRTRAVAKKKGYKLNQEGLFKDGVKIPAATEKEILTIIGVTYKSPEMRNE